MKRIFVILILTIIPLQLIFLYQNKFSEKGNVAGITSQKSTIVNSVSIGDFKFELFGYTSPNALVTFDGQGIYDQTTARNDGYFIFKNRFSPFSPREACLSAKDQFGRVSAPVCLPAFPVKYNITIGPVIIPPTISLNQNAYYIDDTVILSGQTIPNTEVNLSIFTSQEKKPSLSLIKSVEAFSFPDLKALSDNKGNFSFSLPSANPNTFKLFTQASYDDSPSANSTRLKFEILPVWMIIIKFFAAIFTFIKSRILELAIIAEIIYVSITIYNYFLNPYRISKEKALIIREKMELVKT